MQALSRLCRERGDPPAARRAIGRAQCNDAYWHGVFGGLYLPHLREAIWRNLAQAELELRRGEGLNVEVLDLDADGHEEIWIHSDQFSALISPRRGGSIEEYTVFSSGINYANTLTRRREAYHDTALEHQSNADSTNEDGAASIHDIEAGLRLDRRPPSDADPRSLFAERVLSSELSLDQYAHGDYWPVKSWAQLPCNYTIERKSDGIEVVCSFLGGASGIVALEKLIAFASDGCITVRYTWDASAGQEDDFFTTELSLFAPLELRPEPSADVWTFSIETVAKSERGLDHTRQGDSVTLRWPVRLGEAVVELVPANRTLTAHSGVE
ncbi:MAG TPA: alpha-amylase/4-alpha-glucanotransferase domain-containing protein, partial [Gemmatimonadales bacterium]|nr:alpha-amylase/4-alpha-glucanotransferase domain-containing protein [Gemmatimonadales bacterium]